MRASVLQVVLIATSVLAAVPDDLVKHTISASGINASFIGYGARLTNLYVKDKHGVYQDVVMGYDEGSGYIHDTNNEHTYFGAVIGRYSGRMKNGTYTLDGVTHHVTRNENDGADSLHGGTTGYDQRNWTIVAETKNSISFMLKDDAFEGYPGKVVTYATFSVESSAHGPTMTSRLVSIALDGATPLMLTTHPYFNLNAFVDPKKPTILDHTLEMRYSNRYVAIDNIEVPTGQLGAVKDPRNQTGPLDFTKPKRFRSSFDEGVQACGFNCTGIDSNFIIDRPPSTGDKSSTVKALTISSDLTGITMDLYTNQQAIIVYTCNKLEGTIPLKKSQQHGKKGVTAYAQTNDCVAIETQGWIDAINHPEFGQARERETFSYDTLPSTMWTKYVFGTVCH